MPLLALPNELLLAIAEALESQSDLNSLAQADRRCWGLLNPVLYAYNVKNHNGDALHWAAKHGQLQTAQKSLRQGAHVESTQFDLRPLGQAARSGHADIAALLIAHGADVYAKKNRSSTNAITIAVYGNKASVLQVLLDHGVDPNFQCTNEDRLLHITARKSPRNRLAIAKLLVEKGADLEALSHFSETALQIACKEGSSDVLRYLVESGADLGKRTPEGRTLLHLAAHKGNLEAIEPLLEKGVDMESRDNEGFTPFHSACYNGHLEVARLLLDHGANIEAKSHKRHTPLLMAILWETTVFVGADSMPVGITSFLLERGANPNEPNDSGIAPIHIAVSKGDALCKLLLQHGADPGLATEAGSTPLHKIALGGSLEAVKHLLQQGADVQPKDADGNTPLHLAARRYEPALVKLLLEAGADRFVTNNQGQLPIHLAKENTVGAPLTKRLRAEEVMDLLEGFPAQCGGSSEPVT
ncbi:unnamed protein product [Penicillium olsonii]|uniref:Uncharacterized protein n=1 Tax=Penicillium olsonii TaxID=99116 RepID=A0A9W4MRK5_PENOL|nr:unnamed protein product [Penicillium olsonii]CAG8102146.1 unnamed protein product [Penicillium olsonii]CAG8278002.1 unnamed protein product [Penicillium olsonii]